MKTCKTCGVDYALTEYHKTTQIKSGFSYHCKKCCRKKENEYKARPEYKIKMSERRSRLTLEEKQKIREKRKISWKKYAPKAKLRHKERLANDPFYKLKKSLLKRARNELKRKGVNIDHAENLLILGAPAEVVREHIKRQFKKGMTWENYGYNTWHLDHKIPLRTAKNEKELKELLHYTNLQPLWAIENWKKGDKVLPTQMTLTI